jgi:uncharacterized membrane protein YkoI
MAPFWQDGDDRWLTEAVSVLSFIGCDRLFMRRLLIIFLLLAPAIAGQPAHADSGRKERDDLTAARKRGEILALSEILDRVRPQIGDKIIEVEFENDGGKIVYEIYYLDDTGRRREITVNASDASVMNSKEQD